ncbi:MAG: YdcF family protein [Chitinophagales bacterium]
MKKWFAVLAFMVMLLAVAAAFKTPILRSFSNFLMQQDEPSTADAMVVLSGDAFMRGNEGARLYKEGFAPLIICPGGNIEHNLFIITGDSLYESDVCRKNIIRNGVDSNKVVAIHIGTSTAEEAVAVLDYCKVHQLKKIIVVTSLFHTRRAGNVYHKLFAKQGIQVLVRGSHNVFYDEQNWWQNEYGMLALNNEYVKLLFYAIKGEG